MSYSRLTGLPAELHHNIIERLPFVGDVYPLLFVSRSLHAEAVRCIYQTITLRANAEHGGDIVLVGHLESSPYSTLIRRFVVPHMTPVIPAGNWGVYWLRVRRALQRMTGLQHLYFDNSLSFVRLLFPLALTR